MVGERDLQRKGPGSILGSDFSETLLIIVKTFNKSPKIKVEKSLKNSIDILLEGNLRSRSTDLMADVLANSKFYCQNEGNHF